jgi:oligopeptide transport system ATP-binding protein
VTSTFGDQGIFQAGPRNIRTGVEVSMIEHPSAATAGPATRPLLAARGLVKNFPVRSRNGGPDPTREVQAVRDVSLDLWPGETVGLVGESGSGKSTTGRLLVNLLRPTAGQVLYHGRDILRLSRRQMWPLRRQMQIVFQDPFASVDPRLPVSEIVAEPLRMHGMYGPEDWGRARVRELLRMVGLEPEHAARYAHEFDAGDRQRIGIARALAVSPELVVLDEPVAGLDRRIRTSVLGLLKDLQAELGLTYLVMSQDLAAVRRIAHRIAVIERGRIVETRPGEVPARTGAVGRTNLLQTGTSGP